MIDFVRNICCFGSYFGRYSDNVAWCMFGRVSDPFTEIPADMLLFHICIPFAVEHFRPRATIKTVLLHWFSFLGWALGLSEFLLPGAEDGGNQAERGNGRQERGNDAVLDGIHARGALGNGVANQDPADNVASANDEAHADVDSANEEAHADTDE